MLWNRSVPDVQQKCKNWKNFLSENAGKNLVFLDESGVNTNMIRHYARAHKEERAVDSAPVNTLSNTTILSSVSIDGKNRIYCLSGRDNGRTFFGILENNASANFV